MTKPIEIEQISGLLSAFGVSPDRAEAVRMFHVELIAANEIQNLTRLIEPKDFIEGHLMDCLEGIRSGQFEYPALDLGSGGGVPGLLCAILQPNPWVLLDSENQKAAFLERAVTTLGLANVKVIHGRIESELPKLKVGSVVVRAVGKVEKIYGWVRNCSTWNSLVLYKGPGWGAEWEEIQKGGSRGRLQVTATHDYTVGDPVKIRTLVKLQRTTRRADKN